MTATEVDVSAPVPPFRLGDGRAGIGHHVRSEWTKLRSVRSTWICVVVIVVAGIGLSALVSNIEAGRWANLKLGDRAQFDAVRSSQTGEFLSQFVVGVLGALVITAEYATKSIRTTLATTANRTTVLVAKLVVVASVIFVVTEVTAFASFFVGHLVLVAHGGVALPPGSTIVDQIRSPTIPVVDISRPGALAAIFLCGVYLTLLSLLACGLGFALRHTAGAISAFVGLLLVLPLVIDILPSSFADSFERYLPSNLGLAMIEVVSRKTDFAGILLSPWAATGLLVVYTAVAVALGAAVLVRRDA